MPEQETRIVPYREQLVMVGAAAYNVALAAAKAAGKTDVEAVAEARAAALAARRKAISGKSED